MKKCCFLLLAVAVLTCLSACGGQSAADSSQVIEFEAQTWRLSCPGDADLPEGQAARHFADAVFNATNGAVTVEILTGHQATDGDGTAALEAVRTGELDLAIVSSQEARTLDRRLEAVSLPFLFHSALEAETVLDGDAGAALRDVLAEHQLRCVGIGEEGFRCPTNNAHMVASPADLRGMKIRVADSPLVEEAYRLWGADCLTADWPMVFTALRTGTYDGQEEPLMTADAAAVQEVQKYLTRWTGIYSCFYFCMDQSLYDSLSPALRDIADRCGQEAMEEQRQLHRQRETEILGDWSRARVVVTELTEESAAEFRELAQPCYDRFAREVSAELVELLEGAGAGKR